MKQSKTLKVARILAIVALLFVVFLSFKDFAIKKIVNLNPVNTRAVVTSISTDFKRSNNSNRSYSSHLSADVNVSYYYACAGKEFNHKKTYSYGGFMDILSKMGVRSLNLSLTNIDYLPLVYSKDFPSLHYIK